MRPVFDILLGKIKLIAITIRPQRDAWRLLCGKASKVSVFDSVVNVSDQPSRPSRCFDFFGGCQRCSDATSSPLVQLEVVRGGAVAALTTFGLHQNNES